MATPTHQDMDTAGQWLMSHGDAFAPAAVRDSLAQLIAEARANGGDPQSWPDIGPDPLQGPRPPARLEASLAICREGYERQQKEVPDQTVLVWRWHLGALIEAAARCVRFHGSWQVNARDIDDGAPRGVAIRAASMHSFMAIAEDIADSDAVLRSAYAAVEWDSLDENGKEWIAAIVREAFARSAEGKGPKA